MSSWVSNLPFRVPFDTDELQANPIEPKRPLDEERDMVITEMNGDEKLAFSLWRRCEEESRRADLEAEFTSEEEIEREALIRHSQMGRMGTIFEGVLWLSLWQRIGDEHGSIAVTKGFKVIAGGRKHTLMELLSPLRGDQS